ncbi:uncharacterized protein LOC121232861 [Aquila chrysaetos chrysaetos]|uniref:uncharacterized protein LOC121232861 n=1 Tax=Aquila chrysaetos chrysaetos TaxID=223781 RepID=UPI001B7D446D|nr:uncharacterized protein LOC121232861 [Aquila chrysaetos chrysaetos]
MLVSLSLPPPHFNPSRLSEPKTVEPSAPAIDAEPPATAAADERERHWRGVIKNTLVEGTMIQAFPVVIQNNRLKRWEAFDWKVLEKLKTAVSQYGIKSTLAQQLLQFIFSADTLIPQDIMQIVRLVLEPSQMLVFLRHWEALCDREQATPRQPTDLLWAVTTQMLMGTGPFTAGNAQVQCITKVHHLSQNLAYQALITLPDKMRTHVFTQVKQGPNEPFAQFIDRLHKAIFDHPDMDDAMKEKVQLYKEL